MGGKDDGAKTGDYFHDDRVVGAAPWLKRKIDDSESEDRLNVDEPGGADDTGDGDEYSDDDEEAEVDEELIQLSMRRAAEADEKEKTLFVWRNGEWAEVPNVCYKY